MVVLLGSWKFHGGVGRSGNHALVDILKTDGGPLTGAHPRNKALGGGFSGQEFGNNFDNAPGVGPTGPQGYGSGQVL